jgi:chemotaxis protein histidine kinase CheA
MTEADLLDEAVAELYTSGPESFTARRGDLAAQARAAGDTATAKRIAGLRKPTRSAWLINQLVRSDPSVPGRLAELGDQLRTAQSALDGPKIRELSAVRRRLIEDLARQAFQLAGQDAPPAGTREDLTATFGAALADPAVTEQLAAGTLLRAAHRADFSPGGLTLVPPPGGPASRATPAAPARQRAAPASEAAAPAAPRPITSARSATRRAAADAAAAEAAARETAAAREQAAQEAAAREATERAAAERRQAQAEAQQALADATQAVDRATAAEQQEGDAVRELRQQLAEARQQLAGAQQRLADARARTRQAEGARHKARRAVERLQR